MAILIDRNAWTASLRPDLEEVLKSIHQLFVPCFEIVHQRPLIVTKIESSQSPCCNREAGIIYLSADGTYWCQYAYQFSHEYCHFQITRDVAPPFRWFEETICELASYFFLFLADISWSDSPPYPHWRSYASSFSVYVNNAMMKAEPFDTNFTDESNDILLYLMGNCEDRCKNAYIAKLLLPIFQSDPTLWSVVPLLCEIPETLSFEDALHFWCEISPVVHKNSINQISQIFFKNI